MKLTLEDIEKYGTEEEKKVLKEELNEKIRDLIERYIENEGMIDELKGELNHYRTTDNPKSTIVGPRGPFTELSYGHYKNEKELRYHIKSLQLENEKIKLKLMKLNISSQKLARILREY